MKGWHEIKFDQPEIINGTK